MDPKQSELNRTAPGPTTDRPNETRPDETKPDETRSVTEIRHDLQRTRADLDRTVDALGKKLQPSRIAWQARSRVEPELREAGRTIGNQAKRHSGALVTAGAALAGLWVARKLAARKKTKKPFPPEQKGL